MDSPNSLLIGFIPYYHTLIVNSILNARSLGAWPSISLTSQLMRRIPVLDLICKVSTVFSDKTRSFFLFPSCILSLSWGTRPAVSLTVATSVACCLGSKSRVTESFAGGRRLGPWCGRSCHLKASLLRHARRCQLDDPNASQRKKCDACFNRRDKKPWRRLPSPSDYTEVNMTPQTQENFLSVQDCEGEHQVLGAWDASSSSSL